MFHWDKIRNSQIVKLIGISLISIVILIFSLFFLLVDTLIVPNSAVEYAIKTYNNSTTAEMYLSFTSNFLLASITFVYMILTIFLVTETTKSVAESRNAIEQSKKEQRIRDIENRLEKFYMPADAILNTPIA